MPTARRERPDVLASKGMKAKTESQAREIREARTEMSLRLPIFSTSITAGIRKIFPKKGAAARSPTRKLDAPKRRAKTIMKAPADRGLP